MGLVKFVECISPIFLCFHFIIRQDSRCSIVEVGRQDGLSAIYHEERCKVGGLVRSRPQALEHSRYLPRPLSHKFVEPIKDAGFKGLKDHGIHTLHLAISSWVNDGGPVDSNAIVVAESKKFLPGEECAVVSDYGVWDSKFVYDVEEELHRVFRSYSCYGFCFDPLGELIDCHQKVGVALGCFPKEQVEPLCHEGLC